MPKFHIIPARLCLTISFPIIILPSKEVRDLHQAEVKEQLSQLPHWVNFIGHTHLENTGNQRNSVCMSTDHQPQNVFQPILPRLTPLRLKGQERFAQRATLTKGVIRKSVVASTLLLLLLSGGCPNNQCQDLFKKIWPQKIWRKEASKKASQFFWGPPAGKKHLTFKFVPSIALIITKSMFDT